MIKFIPLGNTTVNYSQSRSETELRIVIRDEVYLRDEIEVPVNDIANTLDLPMDDKRHDIVARYVKSLCDEEQMGYQFVAVFGGDDGSVYRIWKL